MGGTVLLPCIPKLAARFRFYLMKLISLSLPCVCLWLAQSTCLNSVFHSLYNSYLRTSTPVLMLKDVCLNYEHELMNHENVCWQFWPGRWYGVNSTSALLVRRLKCQHLDDRVEELPSVSDHRESDKTLLLEVWFTDQQHWWHLGVSWKCKYCILFWDYWT